MTDNRKGFEVLHDGITNKSIAFTNEEREQYGLRGLLPYAVCSQEVQKQRVMANIRRKAYDIERYVLLSSLQDRNERLFYRTVIDNIEEIMPLIYTPTVGQACKEFSNIFRRSKGFYITPDDKGQIRRILDNWPLEDVRAIVVTDGQRILGLGDLGANGMGIPIGKLALYSACAGIPPSQCLPVMLDVGTNNEELLDDILYLGYPHRRIEGETYSELVEEFVMAVQDKWPKALIQFEDFLTPNAYALLNEYKDRVLCFNDDIQGTAAVSLAGVYASTRITGMQFSDLRIMFLGAGSAATGIADLMVSAFMDAGLSKEEAYKRLWFVDLNGLIVSGRNDLMEHNLPYAHDHEPLGFVDAIDTVKPHVLIGATGAPGTFIQEVIEHMSAINERPVIFALSNPTSRAECTAEQAYEWSKGKAVFTSGSPFAPVEYNGQTFKPGQGNNAYIFPGVGLGAIACNASKITDELFLESAKCLAEQVSEGDINAGSLYPPLKEIRDVSLKIAVAVADKAHKQGLARDNRPDNLRQHIFDYMFDPTY
ncbi:MAG: NAD-dependent malic enzyme [Bacteroidota bacterium]